MQPKLSSGELVAPSESQFCTELPTLPARGRAEARNNFFAAKTRWKKISVEISALMRILNASAVFCPESVSFVRQRVPNGIQLSE